MIPSISDLICIWLAVFGVSYTIAELHGPFGMCSKLRRFVRSKAIGDHNDWLRVGIGCPICVSFWISVPIVGFYILDCWELLVALACVGFAATVMLLSPPGEDGP